ncbi:MAG TPA: transglutaminase domain-containing protein [Verrucomicrobiae bacterium]|jgi:hypothetical protein
MNTPPFLVAATLLFWGWQTNHLVLGAIAGALLEFSRVIKMRWSLTQADFNRLWNVCSVLFLGWAVFLFINENTVSFNDFFVNAGRRPEAMRQAGRSALVWFQWFPMIFLPFLLAQAFNEKNEVGLATFSWWLRKQEKLNPNSTLPREGINVAFAYVALTLLSASAATTRSQFFYFGIAALIGWALLSVRGKRYSLAVWCALFAAIAVSGYGGHTGLFRLQKKLEEMNVSWFSRFVAAGMNDKEVRTHIGSIGHLKNSDRIVLRLRTDGSAPPELLRDTSFNAYRKATWTVGRSEFSSVFSEDDQSTWKLLPRKPARKELNIAGYFRGGTGLLPLPHGTAELSELPVGGVETNKFGAVRISAGPGLAIFNARYDRGATIDTKWTEEDLRTYEILEPALAPLAKELGLRPDMPAQEAMRIVASFFADKFQYSTYLTKAHAETTNETALARFLLHTRSGHCEYFATATALLLRHAGVPTRYAVGYSVQEGRGKKYVVRDRHAHAWALVYYDDGWHDFDTTPASWNAIESGHSSWLQPAKDFFSDLWFQFSKFRWGRTEWRKYFMWAPVPLLIIAVVRFFFGKQWKKVRAKKKELERMRLRPGSDSDFYLVEKHFAARGLERRAGEHWSDWLRRLEQHESTVAELHRALVLHQRHRFDPRGLNEAERDELRTEVARWMGTRCGQRAAAAG